LLVGVNVRTCFCYIRHLATAHVSAPPLPTNLTTPLATLAQRQFSLSPPVQSLTASSVSYGQFSLSPPVKSLTSPSLSNATLAHFQLLLALTANCFSRSVLTITKNSR
jgi:hypothetical protein